ncbi:hypothetical protein Tco_0608455, partial [Tanacetum coccineum]
ARDDSLLGTIRFISRHADSQVYGAILPEAITNQALQDSIAYKTYYAITSRAEPPQTKKSQKKPDSAILSEESPSKKKPAKAKKDAATKPKPSKKKRLPDEARKSFMPHMQVAQVIELICDKESWGDSDEEEDDDEHVFENESDDEGDDNDSEDDNNDDDDNDDDDNDDDKNDDDMADSERTESDRAENPEITQSTAAQEEEEYDDERVHTPSDYELTDEEKMEEDEDDEVTKELHKDVNINLGNKDAEMTNADQGGEDQHNKTTGPEQSSSVSSDFTSKLMNLDNTPPRLDETSSQTSSLFTVPVTAILEITFAITIPAPPSSLNPLPQQTTPTLTPITSEATNSFLALPDFSLVFKFNDRVTKLEQTLSEMKQVDQYDQALSSIIVDGYISNQLQEAIQKAIQSHNGECREEALANKKEYIDLVNTSVTTIIREEVKTQLPHILPQVVSDFATPVIEKNVTETIEDVILIDKMEETKSYQVADYKKELYNALVKSYNTDKDLFDSYGEVFLVKRGRDEKDKDQDPSAGSDQGTKRRKTSKEGESSKDSRSKEKKSSSTSKVTSHSQHKSFGKSAHAEEPSHNVDDSEMQQNQEFDTGHTEEQPNDKTATEAEWFKKPKRSPNLDRDWNKRQHIDFRPPQT